MATFSITPTVAQGMLNGTALAAALGSGSKIAIYSGTPPASAAASLSGNTLLATLTMATPPFSGFSDTGTAGRATFGAVTPAAAVATGTASFYRHLDSAGTTAKAQGSAGTSGTDLILNTTAFTSGSTIAVSSGTIDLPYGP